MCESMSQTPNDSDVKIGAVTDAMGCFRKDWEGS